MENRVELTCRRKKRIQENVGLAGSNQGYLEKIFQPHPPDEAEVVVPENRLGFLLNTKGENLCRGYMFRP